ncbi:MAG: T9SS type A sorting domain-containing protein [Bacteroidetes bacterium]|nr:T9SS type A sorting domain-containing protein [Bacteroidota bacterium]
MKLRDISTSALQVCFILFSTLTLSISSLANNCGTATLMNTGTSYTLAIDSDCNYLPSSQNICIACSGGGDAWFKWIPGGSNALQMDATFTVEADFTGNVNVSILYSESFEASGNPCQFQSNIYGYTQYTAKCNTAISPASPITVRHTALDGSGVYFLLVERIGNNTGSVTVTPTLNGTCPQPSNDRCSTPIALTTGNGIDPNAATGGSSANWIDAYSATNKCATKQRLTNTCGAFSAPNPPNEDHYGRNYFGVCMYNGNLGATSSIPLGVQCDVFLENTTYYSFQVPVTAADWAIHFSSYSQCTTGPNNMVAMLFNSLDCNDAENSVLIECDKFNVYGNIPTSDMVLNNGGAGLSLIAGHTYYIVLDGTRGSQCDVEILITKDTTNVLLPVKISQFEGQYKEGSNWLFWETELEQNHDYFEIQKSEDGEMYVSLSQVSGQGNSQETQKYSFEDSNPKPGITYYQLKSVDINGRSSFSEIISVVRPIQSLEIDDISMVNSTGKLQVIFSIAESGVTSLRMLDLTGKQIYKTQQLLQKGSYEWLVPTHQFPTGVYLLQMSQAGKLESRLIRTTF